MKIRPTHGEDRLIYIITHRQHVKVRRISQAGKAHEISIHAEDVPALINALADLTETKEN